ncbi:MAG: hypothetical protein ACOC1U_01490 [Spirochaetota bacterium]
MNTRTLGIVSIALLMVLAGCVPSSDGASGAGTAVEPAEPQPVEVPSVNVVHQLLTYQAVGGDETDEAGGESDEGGSLPTFERGFTLTIGEDVTRIGEAFTGVTPFGERVLIRIRNSVGEEAYAFDRYLVPNATAAIVTDEQAVLYSRPNLASPTEVIVPRGSLAALHEPEPRSGFFNVTTYDHERETAYFDRWVKAEDLSTEDVDVQAGSLLFVARRAGSDVVREELLRNAEGLGESAFVDEVRRELALLRGEEPEDALPADLVGIEIEEFAFTGVINENGTTVYRYPQSRPEYAGTTLDEGAIVDVEERTVEAFTVDGETSSWFRVRNPAGWVFGAFIDPQ